MISFILFINMRLTLLNAHSRQKWSDNFDGISETNTKLEKYLKEKYYLALPTTPIQMFYTTIRNFKVIAISTIDPDNNFKMNA